MGLKGKTHQRVGGPGLRTPGFHWAEARRGQEEPRNTHSAGRQPGRSSLWTPRTRAAEGRGLRHWELCSVSLARWLPPPARRSSHRGSAQPAPGLTPRLQTGFPDRPRQHMHVLYSKILGVTHLSFEASPALACGLQTRSCPPSRGHREPHCSTAVLRSAGATV